MDKRQYKLPILKTLRESIVTVANNASVLFRTLLLPSIIMILVSVGQILMQQHILALENDISIKGLYLTFINLITLITSGILAAIFAVICHRVVLLGIESLPNSFGLYFSRRELRYFGWVVLFGIPIGIGYMVIPMMSSFFMKSMDDPREIILLLNRVWGIAGFVIVSFITAPFILVLPATAIGENRAFKKARSSVRDNIIRLAVVLVIPTLITALIRLTLGHFGPEASNIPYDVFIGLIYLVFLVFQTVALSISYKTLASER